MKKFLGVIIFLALVVGGVSLFIYVNNVTKGYAVSITSTDGGSVELVVNDKEYKITHDNSGSYSYKSGTKLKLTAVPDATGEFLNWVIDGKIAHANPNEIVVSNNLKVEAKFKKNSYNISVKNESGEDVTEFVYSSDNFLEALTKKMSNIAIDAGYKYVYTIADAPVTATTVVREDTVVVCKKVPIDYTVKFMNGETQVGSITHYTVVDKTKPEAPSVTAREGYTMKWMVGTTEWSNYELTLGDVVVTTEWTPIIYNITFKNGDTETKETYTVETVNKPATPVVEVEDGYEIVWLVGSTNYNDYKLTTGDILVVAEKRIITYNITFKNGDTQVGDVSTYTVENKVKPEAPTLASRDGYTLSWVVDSTNWADYTLTTGNVVVTAKWDTIPYTIKFINLNNEVEGETYSYNVENKNKPNAPTISVEAGYNVVWVVGSTEWSNYELTLGDLEVRATKNIITYTIKFMDGNTQVGDATTYTVENKVKPEAPTFNGYNTVWTVDNVNWNEFNISIGDIVVRANKTAIQYTITFKDGETVLKEVNYSIEKLDKPEVPAIDGYVVTWKEGTTNWDDVTLSADNLRNITVTVASKVQTYSVTINNAGDASVFENLGLRDYATADGNVTFVYTAEDSSITLPIGTNNSYDFLRWVNASGDEVTTIDTSAVQDIVITGVWLKTIHLNYEQVVDMNTSGEYIRYARVFMSTDGKVYTIKSGDAYTKIFDSFTDFATHLNNYETKSDRGITNISIANANSYTVTNIADATRVLQKIAELQNGSKEANITLTFGQW